MFWRHRKLGFCASRNNSSELSCMPWTKSLCQGLSCSQPSKWSISEKGKVLSVWWNGAHCISLSGKRARRGGISASLLSPNPLSKVLPSTVLSVEGLPCCVLVDTGCSQSIAHVSCCKAWNKCAVSKVTVSGQEWVCEGMGAVHLQLSNGANASICVCVTTLMPLGFKFLLGMDGVRALGGVTVDTQGGVRFGMEDFLFSAAADVMVGVDERDFSAIYDPLIKCWTATWKWSEGKEPGILENGVKAYSVPQEAKDLYESELQRWVSDGWLLPYDENKYGPAKGLIPLMAVVQQNKKVWPVLDFRELNTYIDAFTADSDVCSDKLREWRRQGVNVSVVDLAKAYLQIRIHESLWPYQTVYFKGQRYCLTRLGFGLNIAPMVMKSVLNCVLLQDPIVRKGTSAYIDDILVNEDIVKASRVEEHLRNFGLVSKPHQRLAEGTRALGLRVWGEQESLFWKRDNDLGDAPRQLTWRAVFSYCGRLLGHYPVCGWLRVAVAFIKRRVNKVTEGWDDVINDDYIKMCLQELLEKVKKDDPVRGQWNVTGDKVKIWVDASSLALGVAVEVNGSIVEDASWLRKDDSCHINMAELDAVIKGLNLALAWKIQKVELMTDSSTVHRWISDGLLGKSRLKTKAASEMLIRRRLGIVLSLIEECDLQLSITLVSSANNTADSLTRVPQRWLRDLGSCHQDAKLVCASVVPAISDGIKEIHHAAGHPGVRRTLYFVKKVHPGVTRRQVQAVVKCCEACQSIDPAPVKWQKGSLEVDRVWQRVGMDITHYDGWPYLTLIDCGPSRFAIWHRLRFQTSETIIGQLETLFYERGVPEELLTDNDTAFRSKLFADFAKKWCVHLNFRCAYVPSGNGIAERCHRTVKVIAARKGCSIAEAVYLYNLMPRDDCDSTTAPVSMLYSYPVRIRGVDPCTMNKVAVSGPYKAGDEVWVKPSNMRCNMQFERGKVTGILSEQAVEVNGVPRHVRDLRSCSSQGLILSEETTNAEDEELLIQLPVHEDEGEEEDSGTVVECNVIPRRSTRVRKARVCNICECNSGGSV
ncbi:uncharacterized protein [Macrobrachium rosenbergii]|uniref:uncharacterized protein n=1 Tax=Macrobrachium rosenbergii TaxID=79674 RepID=UPI0034D58574